MTKNAFDLRVGDIIEESGAYLKITEIKGTYHPEIGMMVRLRFKRRGFITTGYATLKRKFNIVGHV